MRNSTKVAVAVAAALSAGSALAATNPNYTVSVNIAGSSAMRDAVIAEFTNVLCQSGTVAGPFVSTQGVPTASGGENPDFRALTCTLQNTLGVGTNTIVAMYYRSEGGSVFGIFGNPSLNNGTALPINRLNIGPAGGTQPADFNVFETVAQLQADTQTGSVIKDTVDLGVSDVEPAALIGENYGTEYSFIPFAAPSKTTLAAVPTFGAVVGEVYAPIVSNTGGTIGFSSTTGFSTSGLTSQELATIFAGGATDWNQVPSAVATGQVPTSAPITICRRDQGSGTQTVTSTHFLGTNCSTGGKPFSTGGTGQPPTIINYATGDVLNCVKNNSGAIGLVTLQTAAKYTAAAATQITVDGTLGTAVSSAQGKYTYYGEAYFIKNTTVTGVKSTLISKIVSDLESANNVPASASVPNLVALPSHNAPFSPVTPLKTGQEIPIAVGTTGGNVCSPLINQL
jgi:ABC-type phosphate transport system substrate-binding protein